MRREHTSSSIMPDVPFSEDLVFYAPLTEGDLTDHISGNQLIYPNGSVEWDSEEGMYLFHKQAKNSEIYFPVDIYAAGVTSKPYTIFAECKPVTFGIYNYPSVVVIGGYSDTTAWRPSLYSCRYDDRNRRGVRMKRMEMIKASDPYQSGYCNDNGTIVTIFTESSEGAIANPPGWSGIVRQRVSLNPLRDGNDSGDDCYIKDVRIYKRAFTTAEMALL